MTFDEGSILNRAKIIGICDSEAVNDQHAVIKEELDDTLAEEMDSANDFMDADDVSFVHDADMDGIGNNNGDIHSAKNERIGEFGSHR